MRHRLSMIAIATLFVLPAIVFAQDQERIPLLKVKLKVLDPEGNPVEGARIRQSGLRARANRGSHWGWNPKTHGKAKTFVTDAQGEAEAEYPKFVYEKMVTGEVTWMVRHNDFVTFREDRTVEDPETIKLKYGYRIAVTAADADGKRITSNLYAVMAGGLGMKWQMRKGGVLTSPVLDRQQALLRLVQLAEDGPPLFSDLQTVLPDPEKKRVFLRGLKLNKGVRLAGKLDDSVPRPVANGRVVANIIAPGLPDPERGRQRGWSWSDSAVIKPDGTFDFASLPADEAVQLIAVCDGWISAQPEGDLKTQYPDLVRRNPSGNGMRYPQLVKPGTTTANFELKMEKTVDCRVTVHDPNGKPLPNAMVHMWPNQFFFSMGSQVLGSSYGSAKMLRAVRDGKNLAGLWPRGSAYSVKTDETGVALIKNLPVAGSQGVAVEHDEFQQAAAGESRESSVLLEKGKTAELTIKLQAKGTDVIGDGE